MAAAADRVRAAGYDVRAIRPPTVPRGGERLRVVVHVGNTRAEVAGLVAVLAAVVRGGGTGGGASPNCEPRPLGRSGRHDIPTYWNGVARLRALWRRPAATN